MDEADIANDHQERELQAILASRRRADLRPTGLCLFCEEPVGAGLRYCDADCRDMEERWQRAQQRNGRQGCG